jgi:hypothetical protein
VTRIRMNQNGTRTLLSFSHFGVGDADEEFARTIDSLEESNRQALAVWNGLSKDERQRRIDEFNSVSGK